ncbi:MAG: MerR family transcriptional regulator [Calditrichaeota bacterium]|nr:MerR family transcriptional regulator [Calditrichota bacterium]MBT7617968.1 MerR family transcriptional regulator [Calditrichota bacterium]MBT7788590.1 MerR family transcriptional regulator [Calditrichota bacterium]
MDTSLLERVPTIAIGVAAKLLDVSVSSIRQYESVGLILLHHESNGRRLLAPADIERLELLKQKITQNGFNFEGLRRILALVPCWEIKSCSSDDRSECPGFQDSRNPCWLVSNNLCHEKGLVCRECVVYWEAPKFIDNMKGFLKDAKVSVEESIQ